ncbi:SprB repeat-containing protein, partial [Ohtaekwangia koreensis]
MSIVELMSKKLLLTALCLVLYFASFAQESSCGDGVDNDGDGFIDCFDGDCAKNSLCKDFYIGQDKFCQVPPTGVANFGMKLESASQDRSTYSYGRMAIGDLDSDGIPEVVTLHPGDKKLYILNGQNLSVKYTAAITGTAEFYDHVIADVKGDGCAEIFIAEKIGTTFYITSYDCKGVKLWSTAAYGLPITLGLADFGSDGKVELYYRNEILDAATGLRIVKGSGSWTDIDGGPVAVDMLTTTDCASCTGLELVLGGSIYSVNLGARTADAGSLTLVKSIPAASNYFPKKSSFGYVTSMSSVADYNQDGYLDVLTSGSTGSTTGATHAFFWDVKNNAYKRYATPNNWPEGTGRLNISDIDGDGKLNTTFVSGKKLFALKEDMTLLWSSDISEMTSGFTGSTVFDFNNDKSNEIVYRDEGYLYIINGKTGAILTQTLCRSRTSSEYPIVVDVDGDGSTEICVTCATNNNDDINDGSRTAYGQVRTYSSSLESWVPSRKVWNQHAYFNVNVNDDLTIPKVQQLHHLVFSTGSPCNAGQQRALNSFLNQSPFLDSKGCPTYASPDIIFDPNTAITINKPTCPDKNFTVSFGIKNSGNLGLSGSFPVTFYSGDPRVAGAVKLNTVTLTLNNLNIGDTFSASNLTVQGTGSTFTLYVVLNDNGSTTPLTFPSTNFKECDYSNNLASASVSPNPFAIETALISDNIKCGNSSLPSGAVEAYRLVSGVKQTADYTFYWFNSATTGTTASAAYVGSTYTGLTEGTYSVFAVHKGLLCGSSSKTIAVGVKSRTLNVQIVEDRSYTNCKNPNGKLHAIINGGEPPGNFNYAWYAGPLVLTGTVLSVSHELSNTDGLTYSVLVTEKTTGCQSSQSGHVTDATIKPAVSVTTVDAKCTPPNSGSASANVGGVTTGYTFQWYNGSSVKPSPDFTGITYASLTAGTYLVTATNNTSECVSPTVLVTIKSKAIQPVTATVTAQQTSCTPTPNGTASANIAGVTAGYTWKWFKGNNTLAVNQIGTAATVSGLAAGIYTVQATDANGCVDTETVTVVDNLTTPSVSTIINTHQVKCSPVDGSITATGSGSTGPFRYYWFNGNIGTPDTTAANYKASATYAGLAAGYYTVVAVDKVTRCISSKAVVQILNNTVLPVITTGTVAQTSCD